MSRRTPYQRKIDHAWRCLSKKWLKQLQPYDPMYVLPGDVVRAICTAIPGFFTAEQVQFEMDFSKIAHFGFIHRTQIGISPAADLSRRDYDDSIFPVSSASPDIDRDKLDDTRFDDEPDTKIEGTGPSYQFPLEWIKKYKSSPQLHDEPKTRLVPTLQPANGIREREHRILRHLSKHIVLDEQKLNRSGVKRGKQQRSQAKRLTVISRRQEAYVAWLVTNRDFHLDLAILRKYHGNAIIKRRGFTRTIDDLNACPDGSLDSCDKACRYLYRAWGLERMLTWDLPLPRLPSLEPFLDQFVNRTSMEGVSIFIPWYAIRGAQLDVQEVVEHLRLEQLSGRFKSWFSKGASTSDGNSGDLTLQRVYWLYWCYELVLLRRYSRNCEGNMEALDRVFARLMNRSVDLVRKLRHRLRSQLVRCQAPQEDQRRELFWRSL